jgi:hypothetical protein
VAAEALFAGIGIFMSEDICACAIEAAASAGTTRNCKIFTDGSLGCDLGEVVDRYGVMCSRQT